MKHPPGPARPRRVGRLKPVALTAAAVAAFGLTVGAALAASAFNDVTDNHPASAEITAAHQVGVFQGYGDGTFRPDGKLTRGQAELVVHRMLTWQGTDDDGNFEISRADAAVLAMSGLCGLDPDRIPACAAVSEAEVQAAYERGFDDGLDAATPTGSTPPPVTNPAAPATAAEKCDAKDAHGWHSDASLYTYNGGWTSNEWINQAGPHLPAWLETSYRWFQLYAADFKDGYVCTVHSLDVNYRNYSDVYTDIHPVGSDATISVDAECWVTRIDPASGLEYEVELRHTNLPLTNAGYYRYYVGDEATPFVNVAIAGDRPDPDLWSAYDPADCLTTGTPNVRGVPVSP